MQSVAFFNNKGGVGKTSLVYHLAWTFNDRGYRVLLADLDPQSNLSALCLPESRLEELWVDEEEKRRTIYGSVFPIKEELGDFSNVHIEALSSNLGLIVGDIRLSSFEERLTTKWPACLDRQNNRPAFRVETAFYRIIGEAARQHGADIVLIDVGPNLGSINRSALIGADWIVTPIGADLFSIQGLRNLGPTFTNWRYEWQQRLDVAPDNRDDQPRGELRCAGYVVTQPNLYGGEVTKAYRRWMDDIPKEYAAILASIPKITALRAEEDEACLAIIRHYRSLMPLAHQSRKPIFHLRAADGALGAHAKSALAAGEDYGNFAAKLSEKIGLAQKVR